MAISDYNELKGAIDNWLEDDKLSGRTDEFIDLAEAAHKREVRIQEMIERAALTIDDRYVSLPSSLLEPITLRILTSPITVLTYVPLHEMNRQRSTTTGKPTLYTIHKTFEFDKDADQSYSGEIVYYQELTALSDSNTTNALLTRAPDVYLYGSLLHAAPFIMHDERIPVWRAFYEDARNTLNQHTQKLLHGGGPVVSKVASAVV